MSRLTAIIALFALGACAPTFGGPSAIDMPTVAFHAEPGAGPSAVATALEGAGARAVFLASAEGGDWFAEVASATGHHLSGPATMGDLRMAFLAPEPVGDTTHTLTYEGGSFTIQDALYEIRENRLLDLLAFRIEEDAPVRLIVRSLLEYVATDVGNNAALVMAVAVPNAAVGDSVSRMLTPAYFDVGRCETGAVAGGNGEEIRLFYGPEARMYCDGARAEATEAGELLLADLVMGRR